MAISDDLNSIRTHLEDDYTALETLGVSVEDRNIENIKDMANQIYAKFPKTSYSEGSNITLSNTLKGKLDFEDGIVGYGDTSQKSYQGYQMIRQASFGTFTNNGVTFTQRADGSILVNGTSNSSGASVNLLTGDATVTNNDNNIAILPNQAYTLSGANDPIRVVLHTSSYSYVKNANTTFTETGNVSMSALRIIVPADTTINNVVVYPMLEKGSTAHNWEPYVGNTQSPNPSYPQDIEVVRGKNILDMNLLTTISSNRYISSGTNHISIQPNTTYTFSVKSSTGADGLITIYDKSGNSTATYTQSQASRTSVTFTTGANDSYLIINRWYIDSTAIVLADTEPMIEKGSQATSYLPYNTIEVVERGKNELKPTLTAEGTNIRLANCSVTVSEDEFTFVATGSDMCLGEVAQQNTSYNGMYGYLIEIPENATTVYLMVTKYYFDKHFITFYDKDKISLGFYSITTSKAIPSGAKYCSFRIGKGDSVADTTYTTKIMVAFSSIDTYEPYITPQTYQLSLGDIELAKIGNYVDTIEYDVENDKVYKNEVINKYQFTGNEIFGKSSSTNLNGYIFNFSSVTTNILVPANNGTKASILSNAFITKAVDTIIGEATYGIGIRSDRGLYIGAPLGSFENVSALQTYLANNITFMYYTLITPVKIEITTTLKDQIKALYNSHSFNGTTIIEIDGQLPLIIKVRALKG